MASVALLVSSAREVTLSDGSNQPAGLSLAEASASYEAFRSAGLEVTVLTPDGMAPTPDPWGQSWWFHQPREDLAYLAAVVRTFAPSRDQVRVTLQHVTELGLSGCRRIAERTQVVGGSADDAFRTISSAAKMAWSEGRPLVDTLVVSSSNRLSREEIEAAIASQRLDSDQLGKAKAAGLLNAPSLQHPAALVALTQDDMRSFDAVFVPGGLGALTDLAVSGIAGELLVSLLRRGGLIGTVGYGAAALLAAPDRPDGLWPFDGYHLTAVTEDEDVQGHAGRPAPGWRLDAALQNAGAIFDDSPAAWETHVVVDRNLITGQNPASASAAAILLGRRLGGSEAPTRHESLSRPHPSVAAATPRVVADAEPPSVVVAFLGALVGHDLEAALELVDEQVMVDVPPLRVRAGGLGDLSEMLHDLLRSFPDLILTNECTITTGDVVTVLVTAIGTQTADYHGVASTGRSLALEQAWRFDVSNGVISGVAVYWCQAQLYRRLAIRRYDQVAIA